MQLDSSYNVMHIVADVQALPDIVINKSGVQANVETEDDCSYVKSALL